MSFVKSRVVPDGTATEDSTMVEHELFDLLASDAPLDPENVQVVARLSSEAAGVTCGSATGLAKHEATLKVRSAILVMKDIAACSFCAEGGSGVQWPWRGVKR